MAQEDEIIPTSLNNKRKSFLTLVVLALLSLIIVLTSSREQPSIVVGEPADLVATKALTPSPEVKNTLAPPVVTTSELAATAEAAAAGEVTPETTEEPGATDDGALIQVTMAGQVGVLLDEIPEVMRDQVAEAIMAEPESYWIERAQRQVQLTLYRLDFRNYFYQNKGQLPLPPEILWTFRFDEAGPARQTIQGHDLVVVEYTFASTLLTDEASPAAAEPALASPGGSWEEPYVLPIDPELLLQRIGNACINEGGFPPNSYDSENAWIFYDHTCTADSGGPAGCHRIVLPNASCIEAIDSRIGTLETTIRFERLDWDPDVAEQVRVGSVTQTDAPDLAVLGDDLANYRVIYRYFTPDSCALVEQCVGGGGWRRLLQFDATVHNVGAQPLHIGPVVTEDPLHNLFQYNACHGHFHFSNYGEFSFNDIDQTQTSKQAFCVESTSRLSNNEMSPLTHPYSCRFQGVQAGWVDEYVAGLDCQWIDITDVDIPAPSLEAPLTFHSNTDQFLCEGAPVLDAQGNVIWEPSGLTTEDGAPVERPQCEFVSDWEANNSASQDVQIPVEGSFVTSPCTRGHLGPLRNCGFTEQDNDVACAPGSAVQLTCSVEEDNAPQVLRICETSTALGVGVACTHQDALANRLVGNEPTEISFTCPAARDAAEPGGHYALYTAPILEGETTQPITCTAP